MRQFVVDYKRLSIFLRRIASIGRLLFAIHRTCPGLRKKHLSQLMVSMSSMDVHSKIFKYVLNDFHFYVRVNTFNIRSFRRSWLRFCFFLANEWPRYGRHHLQRRGELLVQEQGASVKHGSWGSSMSWESF